MSELLDLSIETLMAACKGNVENLPSFMVHDNTAWVRDVVRLDSQNRIHMRRAVFLRSVAATLPVRAGIWHGPDVQEFHLALEPHHLQGGADMKAADNHQHSRAITKTDKAGRYPDEDDYDYTAPKPIRLTKADVHSALNEADGRVRGVASAAVDDPRSE